jgi:hypothetical protein
MNNDVLKIIENLGLDINVFSQSAADGTAKRRGAA